MARIIRISLDLALVICKSAKPCVADGWRYAKVEMVPPMTQGFFQGIGGKTIENFASGISNAAISMMQSTVNAMDAAEVQRKKNLEADLKAKQEKAAAEAKLAAEEKAKAAAEAKVKEAEAAKAAAAKAKAAAEKAAAEKPKEKPAEAKKVASDAKKKEAKKPDPKKKK